MRVIDGIVLMAAGALAFVISIVGVRSRRSLAAWTAALALSSATLVTGALLLQDDPDLASWLIGPPLGAVLGVANIRSLFASGGPFRT